MDKPKAALFLYGTNFSDNERNGSSFEDFQTPIQFSMQPLVHLSCAPDSLREEFMTAVRSQDNSRATQIMAEAEKLYNSDDPEAKKPKVLETFCRGLLPETTCYLTTERENTNVFTLQTPHSPHSPPHSPSHSPPPHDSFCIFPEQKPDATTK